MMLATSSTIENAAPYHCPRVFRAIAVPSASVKCPAAPGTVAANTPTMTIPAAPMTTTNAPSVVSARS